MVMATGKIVSDKDFVKYVDVTKTAQLTAGQTYTFNFPAVPTGYKFVNCIVDGTGATEVFMRWCANDGLSAGFTNTGSTTRNVTIAVRLVYVKST